MGLTSNQRLKALDLIYDAALEPGGWPVAIDAVAHSLDGAGASLVSVEADGGIDMRVSTSPVDAAARDSYNQRYGGLDQVMARLSGWRTGSAVGCYELVDRTDFLASEFYADWLRQLDLGDGLFLVLRRAGSATTFLSIGAPLGRDSFATAERKRIGEFLASHIRRAITIQNRLATADTAFVEFSRAGDREHPVALVGGGNRLVHCAGSFVSAIERARLSVFRGRLRASSPAEQAGIDRALACALRLRGDRAGTSLAFGPGSSPTVTLHVMPIGESLLAGVWPEARALVVAETGARADLAVGWLRATYGLTEAETAVAQLVAAEPVGLRSIAGLLGISVNTVKTHLQRIFEKTDTHRQADLVRLLLGAAALRRGKGAGARQAGE